MLARIRTRRPMKTRLLASAFLIALAAPAVSSAATLSADRPCYAPNQEARITGSGYTPSGEVVLSFNVVGSGGDRPTTSALSTVADAAGNIDVRVRTPRIPMLDNPARVFLSATDQEQAEQGPPPLVTTEWQISIFNVSVLPWELGIGQPRRRALYLATGFQLVDGKILYAHYIRRGQLRKTHAIGRLRGACGDLDFKRARQFPFRPVRPGIYRIKVDATRRYPNNSRGWVFRVKVSQANAAP
jgi:hypothetical protein